VSDNPEGAMADDKPSTTNEIALPIGKTEQGHIRLVRVRGDETGPKELRVGVLRPVEDEVPGADIIELKSIPGSSYLGVKTVYEPPGRPPAGPLARKPMAVSSEKFDSNWDSIFGKKPKDALLN